jgi:glycosyltransferase involved in cell wall biosynthesis
VRSNLCSGPLRVLLCIDALGVGGKERQAVELIRGLGSAPEVDCHIVCFDTDDFYLRDLSSIGISVDFVPRRVRWDVEIFQKLRRIIKTYRPDVIHTNGLVSSFYALPLAKIWRIPLVNGSIRNAFANAGFRWTLERLLLECSDYRVANSHAGLRSRNLSEQQPMNLVIHNGFDFARVDRPGVTKGGRSSVGDVDTKTVGMVAEFNRFKDYFTFIEAARIISGRKRNILFVAVGDGETLNDCQKAAEGIEVFTFLGKRKNIEELVGTFNIGVLCSFVEGLPNSIMEYMALGKPVVATDGGGTRELVAHGETGFLVPQGDAQALAAAIEHLIDHPDVAERMGKAGEEKVRREFSITRLVDETIALYKLAVANSRGSALPGHWRKSITRL